MIHHCPVEQTHRHQRDDGKCQRRLPQGQHYAEELNAQGREQQRNGLDRATDSLSRKGNRADEIVEVIEILKQAFHCVSPGNRKERFDAMPDCVCSFPGITLPVSLGFLHRLGIRLLRKCDGHVKQLPALPRSFVLQRSQALFVVEAFVSHTLRFRRLQISRATIEGPYRIRREALHSFVRMLQSGAGI